MPLHDFLCRACGHAFEALVMGKDQPICPQCGSTELTKQMSTFAGRTGGKGASGSSAAAPSVAAVQGEVAAPVINSA